MNFIYRQQDAGDPNSLSSRFRQARARRVMELISAVHAEKGQVSIIDLGGEPDYWRRLFDLVHLKALGARITLVNPQAFEVEDRMFEAIAGDACDLPQYRDGAFDLVHSNSVIEHVGDWPKMEGFARQVRRLAVRYYVQTPYFWFPIEPHFSAPFFHWRSEQARARALMRRRHGFADRAPDMGQAMRDVQHARLLDKAQFGYLFPDAEHIDEKVAGLTKSLIAIRA